MTVSKSLLVLLQWAILLKIIYVHLAKHISMVAIATFVPGASYATNTFTLPWASINTVLTGMGYTSVGAADSTERLLWALLTVLAGKQVAGTLSQPTCGCEVSQQGSTYNSVWETQVGTFTASDVLTILATFRLTSNTQAIGNNVANV